MRSTQLLLLLAVSGAACANPAFTGLRALDNGDQPVASLGAARENASAPVGVTIDTRPGLEVGRPGAAASLRGDAISMTDNLNALALLPAVLNGQTGSPIWSDPSITGLNRWLATTVAGRSVGAVNETVDGNSTTKVRFVATTGFGQGAFFTGARYQLLVSNSPDVRLRLQPGADQPARFEHDLFVTSLASLWTSEPIYVTAGFITARLMWGGTCVVGCEEIGLPTGALPSVYTLGIDHHSYLTGMFRTCEWIGSAPNGATVGDEVVMQTGAWLRVRHDHNADGTVGHALDFNDGTGFHVIYNDTFLTGLRIDSLGFNGSFESVNSPMYVDNISASGVEFSLPDPPLPLTCGQNGYIDDMQWLNPGPLQGQSPLWFDALSSKANVDVLLGDDQVIRQTVQFPDGEYREEFTRTLPEAVASPGLPWTLCEEVTFSSGVVAYGTTRGFAPVSFLDNSFVSRLAFGNFDPNATPSYSRRVFIQHNAAYNPIDDEDTADPNAPGPNGNGGPPRIGGAATIGDPNFDYYDTGVTFPLFTPNVWCISVEHDNSMTVKYAGVDLVGGVSGVTLDAFVHSISELRHESDNQVMGDKLVVDDLHLDCIELECACTLPALQLVYHDNLQWANLNVTIDANDDDSNPATPFRWSAAANMPVVDLGAKSYVLKMENLFQDTTQVVGDFTLFTQASTQMPNVIASSTRGYSVRGDYKFTDGATTRAWAVAEADIIPGLFRTNAWILYSATTGTIWHLRPDTVDPINNDAVWVDTDRTLASLGVAMNQWFGLTITLNLDGRFTFRINGVLLTDGGGQIVHVDPLQTSAGGLHTNLDRYFLLSGDDASAPDGSILYADNIRAWSVPCPGDVNEDGLVTFADLNVILGAFNTVVAPSSYPNIAPDADHDGVPDDNIVNFADLNAALGQYNNPCDQPF